MNNFILIFYFSKGYKFPISVVIYHLIVKLLISAFLRYLYRLLTGKGRVQIPVITVVRKIMPTSFFAAVDIGFSQWGLEFVHVAL
jgi:solute carrier family 35, member C2